MYHYQLEPYKGINTRYVCPNCKQAKRTFSKYIDTKTGNYLNENVGRCNREEKCGYHYTPKQYFLENRINFENNNFRTSLKPKQEPSFSFISCKLFKQSLQERANMDYLKSENHFIAYLNSLFGVEVASGLISKYFIGTSKKWRGATIFWQIDISGKIRTGKIMLYNPDTGKRIKEPFNHIDWVHKTIKTHDFNLKQCLFGEHLMNDRTNPVAIVESEKTAIIASVYFPQFIWIATGGKENLTIERVRVLEGRNVVLFPDISGYDKWLKKSQEFFTIGNFIISDLLERKAKDKEREAGLDLVDYLI